MYGTWRLVICRGVGLLYVCIDLTMQVRLRALQAARTLQGSIYQGLRSDYLLTITLPWTLGRQSKLSQVEFARTLQTIHLHRNQWE